MDKEDRKIIKRQIQKFCKEFANTYDFKVHRRTFMVRNRDNLLQMIVFDFPPSSMQYIIAIQPLYFPSEDLFFNFGEDLNYFRNHEVGSWGNDIEKIEEDIIHMNMLLVKNVIPWFDEEVSSPEMLIEFICKKNNEEAFCDSYHQELFLIFSYLYTKKYEEAKENLPETIVMAEERPFPSESMIALLKTFLTDLDNKAYSNIENTLEGIIKKTKEDCGISKLV